MQRSRAEAWGRFFAVDELERTPEIMAEITKRSEDYSRWYQDVIREAELADNSPVRGCMVIRPNGYAIWENIQRTLDDRFKELGHVNAYFPLLIPKSFLAKEAEHVEGFAKECAIVTHHRLKQVTATARWTWPDPESEAGGGVHHPAHQRDDHLGHVPQVDPELPRPAHPHQPVGQRHALGDAHAHVPAHHRVPLAGGAHRPRHRRGGREETLQMLEVYRKLAEETLAIPVIRGVKTDREKFAGADHTYCIEAMMQDGKALQAGHQPRPGPEFRQGFRRDLPGPRQQWWTTSGPPAGA